MEWTLIKSNCSLNGSIDQIPPNCSNFCYQNRVTVNRNPLYFDFLLSLYHLRDCVEVVDGVLEVGRPRGDEDGVLGGVEAQRVGRGAATAAQLQDGPGVTELCKS